MMACSNKSPKHSKVVVFTPKKSEARMKAIQRANERSW